MVSTQKSSLLHQVLKSRTNPFNENYCCILCKASYIVLFLKHYFFFLSCFFFQVRSGSLVFDPFVGTGKLFCTLFKITINYLPFYRANDQFDIQIFIILYLGTYCNIVLLSGSVLVSCSHFGAHVMGSDIDHTLLHGRGTETKGVFFFKFNNQIDNMLLTMLTTFFFYNYTTSTIIFSDKC